MSRDKSNRMALVGQIGTNLVKRADNALANAAKASAPKHTAYPVTVFSARIRVGDFGGAGSDLSLKVGESSEKGIVNDRHGVLSSDKYTSISPDEFVNFIFSRPPDGSNSLIVLRADVTSHNTGGGRKKRTEKRRKKRTKKRRKKRTRKRR